MSNALRVMLRAEVREAALAFVSYAFDLTANNVFVVTDEAIAAGSEVTLRLSFIDRVDPVEVRARVAEFRIPGAPGDLGGVVLAFTEDSRPKIRTLLDQLSLAQAAAMSSHRPYRALLVEDSPFTADMFAYGLARFFRQPEVALDHAEDAERAWAKLRAAKYDVVIVDYFLPAETGAELIARVRSDARLAHIPVVAISVGGRDAREASLSAGADLFLDKPLVFRDLFHTLRLLRTTTRDSAVRGGTS